MTTIVAILKFISTAIAVHYGFLCYGNLRAGNDVPGSYIIMMAIGVAGTVALW